MKLLSTHNGRLRLTEFIERDCPPYAVLSHRWGEDADEVTHKDIVVESGKSKAGYQKILFCMEQIRADGLEYFWIDTCCIDKTNFTELSEAINSMFRWYEKAVKCYVYMSDVSLSDYDQGKNYAQSEWESAFRRSNWFTRGWTLQELIAPTSVEFFTPDGYLLGDKASLVALIHEITRIPVAALRGGPLSGFSVEERMSWATSRQTRREEDMAYSLFGIFEVYLPLIYGEGQQRAIRRLRREIEDNEKQNISVVRLESLAVHKASKDGDIRRMKEVLRLGTSVDVQATDDDDRTALHHAKTARIADLLITAGAALDQEDLHGQTPLHRAIKERRLDVVKKLLSKHVETTRPDNAGKTCIDYAEFCPAASWMIQHGPRSDGLSHMAWLGDAEGVAFFLSQGSSVNKRNSEGETALTLASQHGDTDVIRILLDAGADIEFKRKDGSMTPLLLTVSSNRKDAAEMLLLAGADLNATDEQNHDALTQAVYHGHWDIARMLIERGARVNTADHRGNTPLHCSVHRASSSFTQYLVKKGARVNAQNIFGGTPLLEGIEHDTQEAQSHSKILLDHGADVTIANHNGYTPLSEAARVGNEEVVKLLLKVVPQPSLSSNSSLPGAFSWTPLAEACFNVHPGCVKLLLEANVYLESRTDERLTALHLAVQRHELSAEIVRMLIKQGAAVDAKDKNNFTPLAYAAKTCEGEVVQALLDAGASTETRVYAGDPKENGFTPLLLAVDANNQAAMEALIDADADLEAQTTETRRTALMVASKSGEWDLVYILIACGVNVNTRDAEMTTPLMEAAKAGKLEIIEQLIDRGADKRLRDDKGRTAWTWAKHKGYGSDFALLKDDTA